MDHFMSFNYTKHGSSGDSAFFEPSLKEALFDSRHCNEENFIGEVKMYLEFYITYQAGFDWYFEELTIFEAQPDFNLGMYKFFINSKNLLVRGSFNLNIAFS